MSQQELDALFSHSPAGATPAGVADVEPGSVGPLRRLLARMGEDPAGNAILPFGSLRSVHFARLVLQGDRPRRRARPLAASNSMLHLHR